MMHDITDDVDLFNGMIYVKEMLLIVDAKM
jgi:hypothetical protein